MHPELVLENAERLVSTGNIDFAIQSILTNFYDLLLAERFSDCNEILKNCDVESTCTYILLTILSVTVNFKNYLSMRQDFYLQVKRIILERGDMEENLLIGLE